MRPAQHKNFHSTHFAHPSLMIVRTDVLKPGSQYLCLHHVAPGSTYKMIWACTSTHSITGIMFFFLFLRCSMHVLTWTCSQNAMQAKILFSLPERNWLSTLHLDWSELHRLHNSASEEMLRCQ